MVRKNYWESEWVVRLNPLSTMEPEGRLGVSIFSQALRRSHLEGIMSPAEPPDGLGVAVSYCPFLKIG